MEKIVRTTWTLTQASSELGISRKVIENLVKSWPLKSGIGNKGKMILSRKIMRYLHLHVRTKMYFTFIGLKEIMEGRLNILYNKRQLN